jgi:hypothetical protein
MRNRHRAEISRLPIDLLVNNGRVGFLPAATRGIGIGALRGVSEHVASHTTFGWYHERAATAQQALQPRNGACFIVIIVKCDTTTCSCSTGTNVHNFLLLFFGLLIFFNPGYGLEKL